MRCGITVGYAAYPNMNVGCSGTFFNYIVYLHCLCSCILCIFLLTVMLHFIVARLFSLVIYFVHSMWFLSLIIWTAN